MYPYLQQGPKLPHLLDDCLYLDGCLYLDDCLYLHGCVGTPRKVIHTGDIFGSFACFSCFCFQAGSQKHFVPAKMFLSLGLKFKLMCKCNWITHPINT